MNLINYIAIITMIIDHIGAYLLPNNPYLRVIGRISELLWPMMIIYGYRKTKNVEQYSNRLLFLSFISQIPYSIVTQSYHLNTIFSLYFGLQCIRQKTFTSFISWYFIANLFFYYLGLEYFFFNAIIILNYFQEPYKFLFTFLLVLTLVYFNNILQFFILLSYPILEICETKINIPRINRFLKYSIYPLHYTIIGVILYYGY
jgi:hypothetical protein